MSIDSIIIKPLLGYTPTVGQGTYLAPSAALIGEVRLGRDCSVWYSTVLRGDVGPIEIGDETNIQDGTVVHGTFNKAFTTIGSRVTVGHNVTLHGCRINDLCLIGMSSTIMDGAVIPRRTIVGAGSLITEGARFEEGWLVLGRPAKSIRKLTSEELNFLDHSADNYLRYKDWYQNPSKYQTRPTKG